MSSCLFCLWKNPNDPNDILYSPTEIAIQQITKPRGGRDVRQKLCTWDLYMRALHPEVLDEELSFRSLIPPGGD